MTERNRTEPVTQSSTQPVSGSAVTGPAQPQPTRTNWKLLAGLIAAVVVIIAVIVGIVVLLYNNPGPTAVIRDIFIIALAFTSFLIGLMMLVLIFQLQSLIALLRNEIKPMLTNANQTVNTVRGTAVFVSDNLLKPTIGLASFVAGLRGVQQAVMGRFTANGSKTTGSQNSQKS